MSNVFGVFRVSGAYLSRHVVIFALAYTNHHCAPHTTASYYKSMKSGVSPSIWSTVQGRYLEAMAWRNMEHWWSRTQTWHWEEHSAASNLDGVLNMRTDATRMCSFVGPAQSVTVSGIWSPRFFQTGSIDHVCDDQARPLNKRPVPNSKIWKGPPPFQTLSTAGSKTGGPLLQKIFIAMYCTLPAALPLPPSPIAVTLACRPCAHITTLAPSSWLAVHANFGCVQVGSLPLLQSSSSGVYVIGNDYNRHRVCRRRHGSLLKYRRLRVARLITFPLSVGSNLSHTLVSLTARVVASLITAVSLPCLKPHEEEERRSALGSALGSTRVACAPNNLNDANAAATRRSPSTCAADDDYDGGTMTAMVAGIPPTLQR
ncbi:hypothetical protein EDB83DRAFT_2555001 [Lactarius deliciosus]|nr:hypothetical protein EDB83DRAFT_2555001 [Lactarius deliciosus]